MMLKIRNKLKKIKTAIISVLALMSFLPELLSPSIPYAADPRDEYKKIQKDIKTQKEKLERAKRSEYSVLEELDRINRELHQVQTELKRQRKKRKALETAIKNVEAEIAQNNASLSKQTEWLKRKLRTMQRHGYSGDVILMLLTAGDVSQLIRRWRYIKELTIYDHNMMESYKKTLSTLSKQEDDLKKLYVALKKTEKEIEINLAEISGKKSEKETLLASVRREKDSYEKMLRELKEASKRLLEIIRRAEEADTAGKGFYRLKGRLPWPVNGRIAISYGSQKDPQFNTPIFRSGIYIKAEEDSLAKAVHNGKVVFAEWFKGYGQLIIISHGDGYHTLYANLEELFYKVGDIIKEQQVIGKVGESGTINAPGLYFELRYKGKPLDPTQWLKRR